ncbi:hypothetical protein PTKIN_Ptkin19aG0071300 [Pterospermum kingtungense]
MSSSSTEEDPQPEEKRLKIENKDDPLYIFHYDRETYLKKLYDFSIVGGDDPDASDDDEERDMTEEEAKLYYDALAASDGFDVPEMPSEVQQCGMIIPVYLTEDSLRDHLHYSKAAINFFNKTYGTNYKVVQVEKSMQQGSRGINYYITFQAKIDDDNSDTAKTDDDNSDTAKTDDDNSDTTTTDADNSDSTITFEALVLRGIPEKKGDDPTEVIFCREKGGRTAAAEEDLESGDGKGGSAEEAEGKNIDSL